MEYTCMQQFTMYMYLPYSGGFITAYTGQIETAED